MKFELRKDEGKRLVKAVRFPKDLLEEIEKVVEQEGVTFSKFVIEACKYALDNMEEK